MDRIVIRTLPNGMQARVQPFHVSLEGLQNNILCRNHEDYDAMVKYIAICGRRKNVIIVIYAVVSNHSHEGVLARNQMEADAFGEELKRMYSMWIRRKYGEEALLQKVDSKAIPLDNDRHVRNALAYIPRNAIDNGSPVQDYKWSGFRAMFSERSARPEGRRVSLLTKREREDILHTGDKLKNVPWMLDDEGCLLPESFCDAEYLEQAFNHDSAFWLRAIGSVNPAEMEETLVNAPRERLPDSEFYKVVADTAGRWFNEDIGRLPKEKKLRLIPYLWRTRRTTVNQLARVLGMDRDETREAVRAPGKGR